MTTFLLIVIALLATALGVFILLKKLLEKKLAQAKADLANQVEKGRKLPSSGATNLSFG